MKRALLVLLAAAALAAVPSAASADDPLICVDPGATSVGPYTVDPPLVCVL